MLLDRMSPAALASAGLVEGLTSEEYHAAPGTSKSGLDHLCISPAHLLAYLEEPRQETPALRFGRIFHAYILEGLRIAAAPDVDRRTKGGREAWAEFQDANQGAEIVTADEASALAGMRESVFAHPKARPYLEAPGRCELSRWAYEPQSGELCKVRPDKLLDVGVAFDLKSAEDASKRGFAKACAKYRYHVQAAFYPDILGLDDKRFAFIAVEKTPPYACGVYLLTPEDVEWGRHLYQRGLMRLADCKINKCWPAYSDDIEEISLPKWATRE